MEPKIFSQFELLRAHVESTMERPSILMVTSAKTCDGKSFTAFGLAERLADAGRRVVLVQYRESDETQAPNHSALALRRAFPIVSLPVHHEGSSVASTGLRVAVEELRAKHDYTIVDAAPMLKSRTAILLASMVDGILVTVRLGRTSDADDVALVASLRRADASVLGVVAAGPKDIDTFAGRLEPHYHSGVVAPMIPPTSLEHTAVPAFEGRRR